jgi:hypothetical protein
VAFFNLVALGHFYSCLFVFLINVGIFCEFVCGRHATHKAEAEVKKVPFFALLQWYFFIVAAQYFYAQLF